MLCLRIDIRYHSIHKRVISETKRERERENDRLVKKCKTFNKSDVAVN
jgi:hypothetical protein